MLRISSRQWSTLADSAEARFERRMVAHMRVRSQLGLPEPELDERTRRLLQHGRAHGIQREVDLRRFLELIFDGVDNPALRAEFNRILALPGLGSAARISHLADAANSAQARQRA